MATKHSKQRDALINVLRSTKMHPTADWLYAELRKEFPNISLGTVYRNLKMLSDDGSILKLDIGIIHFHFHTLHLLKKRIGFIRIKQFVGPHHRHQILRIRQIDDVVCITWKHMYRLNALARHVKGEHLIRADFALFDAADTGYHHKELPLGVVPMLALGDTGLGDIDAKLSAGSGLEQFRKTATVVHVHF